MSRLLHLIFFDKAGKKLWYTGVDRKMRDSKWQTIPLADDDPSKSKPVAYEMAVIARKRFREDLGIETHFAFEPNSECVYEETPTPVSPIREDRVPVKATLDEVDWYKIIPVSTPQGPRWILRFEQPELVNQYVSEKDPITVLQKAQERGLLKFATTFIEPAPQPPKQQSTLPPGVCFRPGNRR